MNHPEFCYANDLNNNCIIIKWGEKGYYKTNYPEGEYTQDIIDELNHRGGITKAEAEAMKICSMIGPSNWDEHYQTCLKRCKAHM